MEEEKKINTLNAVPNIQRALILQGGGALGAYEVGVIKALYEKLTDEDVKNGYNNKPLFDIIAGTSIGAINGAILVSQVLENNGDWKKSIEKLEEFWKIQLSSNPDYKSLWLSWYMNKDNPNAASEESARRYYSVQSYFITGAANVFTKPTAIDDDKFYDNYFNKWYRSKYDPLKESIEKYAKFPIATSFDKKQPRLLVISVDVLDAATVTFDSYEKPNGKRESKYINYNEKREDSTNYFWDGSILSNTPIRELIQTHRDYWKEAQRYGVPDLEIYIVDLWPNNRSKLPPLDRNGIKNLHEIIQFSNKTSYDEKVARIVTDYINLTQKLVKLAKTKGVTFEEIGQILDDFATSKSRTGKQRQYKDLIEGRFRITKVKRIERKTDPNSIWGKIADFTSITINMLMEQGYKDTMDQM